MFECPTCNSRLHDAALWDMQLGWVLFMRGGGAVNEGPMACQPPGLYFELSTSNRSITKKKKQLNILTR